MNELKQTATKNKRRRARVLIALAALVLVISVMLAAAAAWLLNTTAGVRAIFAFADALLPAQISADGARGSFRTGFGFDRLRVQAGATEIVITQLDAQLLDTGLSPLRFDFDTLHAQRVDVRVRPAANPSREPPASIASPVAVSAQQLRIGTFLLLTGADPASTSSSTSTELREIETQVTIGPGGYRIEQGAFAFGSPQQALRTSIRGTLGGARPFPLDAQGSLQTQLQEQGITAQWRSAGSLELLSTTAQLTSEERDGTNVRNTGRGALAVDIASFNAPALQRLYAQLEDIELAHWVGKAPQARLNITADLRPSQHAAQQTGDKALVLQGPVRIENKQPGPVDQQRIPVRSAQAQVEWSATGLQAREIQAELIRGRASGSFSTTFKAASSVDTPWSAQATLRGVDLSTIHSKLRALLVDGDVRVRHEQAAHEVTGSLSSRTGAPAATLNANLRVEPQRLLIRDAQLVLGNGNATAKGELNFGERGKLDMTGELQQLNLALLVQGLDTRLTGTFAVEGQLQPQTQQSQRRQPPANGKLSFQLTDSAAFGRPLTGRGTASLNTAQQLDVDIELAARSARLVARGGLGSADKTLTINLSVPALDELAVPVRGALDMQAQLSGAWNAPAIEARAQANKLRFGQHSINSLTATLNYSGGSDGTLAVRANASEHRYRDSPILSLRVAAFVLDGRLSQHTAAFTGANEERQGVAVTARGGWSRDGKTGAAWRGQLTQAQAGAPFDLRLLAPTDVLLAANQWAIGSSSAADFDLATGRFEQVRASGGGQQFASSGRFDNLRLSALETITRSSGFTPPQAEPLALRGSWQLKLGNTADGDILIERSSGDLYAGNNAASAIGLQELRLQTQLRANVLQFDAALRGIRAGQLTAQLNASVERDAQAGWRLAQQRPLKSKVKADMPSIDWLNAVFTDRVRANVRIGGALTGQLQIDGTLADPRADGRIDGEQLRMAWIEQGVRLENGSLRTHIEGSDIVIDELRFTGPPRVRPDDKRAAGAVNFDEPGFVAASGRLKLTDLTGLLQVQAQQLPLLQQRDRWIIATGGANVELSTRKVQINGAVAANAGFVDFSRNALPSLSSDVVVRESVDTPRERDPRVMLGFDLGVDLGERFYLRGLGLNTRIDGAVRLRSDGRGLIRASGAVNAQDGVYEGYGQKLKIARGRVNFQGAAENPGLDVLALRENLPPEAGEIGVSITRTAANPLIRLHSEPQLSDVQTLSWLVLGRPAEQGGGDNIALARAAVGLLSGTGEGIPTTLARQLGIDDISLRSGQVGEGSSILPRRSVAGDVRGTGTTNTAGAEIISIGKRFGDSLSISYEQALTGAAGVVQLSYQLTRRVSVIARAGTENALDLVYTVAFD